MGSSVCFNVEQEDDGKHWHLLPIHFTVFYASGVNAAKCSVLSVRLGSCEKVKLGYGQGNGMSGSGAVCTGLIHLNVEQVCSWERGPVLCLRVAGAEPAVPGLWHRQGKGEH